MEIELTDKDRLLLANQYEILGLLQKDDVYTRMAETLRLGHKWLYSQYFESFSENLSDEMAEHVLDILELYSNLRGSYAELSDKTGIKEDSVQFKGFDGNRETDLLCFARSLIKHDTYVDVLGEKAKNSHMPTTELYTRMLDCWKDIGSPTYPLSKEDILKILAAQIHPDSRK